MVIILALYIIPLLFIFANSFITESEGETQALTLNNYIKALSDHTLYTSILSTFVFTILASISQLLLAFGAALLTFRSRLSALLKWVFVLPYFLPTIVVVVAWQFFIDPTTGILSNIIDSVGFKSPNFRGPGFSLPTMLIVSTYEAFPFCFAFLFARLSQIPTSYFQISELNQVSSSQVFSKLIWPELKPMVAALFLIRLLINLLKFDVPWLVYAYKGESWGSETFPVWLYRACFLEITNSHKAMAAVSLFYLFCILLLTFFDGRKTKLLKNVE